jgi:hypothetical protein
VGEINSTPQDKNHPGTTSGSISRHSGDVSQFIESILMLEPLIIRGERQQPSKIALLQKLLN